MPAVHSESENPDRDEAMEEPILPLFDCQWEAKKRGEPISPDRWKELHPRGEGGMSDFRLLDALYEAACAIHEDSGVRGEPGPDSVNGVGKMENQLPPTDPYISNPTGQITELRVGHKIGKFEIKEVLGQGAQATTYKVWDPDVQRTAVVKAYHGTGTAWLDDAIVQEGQKLAKVRSPYVITCHHVERSDGVPYLVLEYVAGQSLAKLHARAPLRVSESLRLIGKVAEGRAAMHARGLLHRDIKPSNIVVGHNGVPKLLDFGLALPLGDPKLGDVSGTFSYMAPEQARGDKDRVEPRTDIFGLGATLYFLLTGHSPYEGTPEEVWRAAREGNIVPPRRVIQGFPSTSTGFACAAWPKHRRIDSDPPKSCRRSSTVAVAAS